MKIISMGMAHNAIGFLYINNFPENMILQAMSKRKRFMSNFNFAYIYTWLVLHSHMHQYICWPSSKYIYMLKFDTLLYLFDIINLIVLIKYFTYYSCIIIPWTLSIGSLLPKQRHLCIRGSSCISSNILFLLRWMNVIF